MATLRELTEKEISLMPRYRQLWHDTAFSTIRLNHKEVQDAIQCIYKIFDLEIPRIHFCNNLYALVEKSRNLFQKPYFCEDGTVFASQVMAQIHELHMSFFESIGHWDMALTSQLKAIDGESIECNISNYLQQSFKGYDMYIHWIFPRIWYADEASLFDFHFSVAKKTLFKAYDDIAWQAYKQLIHASSWLTAFESDCFVCERPKAFGDGSDVVKQFVRGKGGDLLSFNGIADIDVVKLGTKTEFRIGDGIAGNAGFGTGDLLMTLQGTTGFTASNIIDNINSSNAAHFGFS